MPLARLPCLKCQAEEIFRSDHGQIRCVICNSSWRPLSLAESSKFNSRTVRVAAENADAVARQRAKNSHAKVYISTTPLSCGHYERFTSTGRCRECNLAWQWRRYHRLNPDATPRGRSAARDAAIEAGSKTYAEGPCRNALHGYAPERYVSNRSCVECAKESQRARIESVA